jgi:hypothetical protein
MDLGVDGPMDFWKMSSQERSIWLDDGLHLTEKVVALLSGGSSVVCADVCEHPGTTSHTVLMMFASCLCVVRPVQGLALSFNHSSNMHYPQGYDQMGDMIADKLLSKLEK